ncbi:MAG: histidine phosphatase family protein [Lachnospiraceae bacterium]
MKLLIVRHGDPDYSIDSLTEKGWREAEALAERISQLDIHACYVSPLGRAKDTASLTLQKMNLTATECDWLREFPGQIIRPDVGDKAICWDWLPQDWTVVPEYYDYRLWSQTDIMKAGNVPTRYQYVCDGLDQLLAKHGYHRNGMYYDAVKPNNDTLVFFCHFGVECVLLSHLLGISPMPLWHGFCAAPTSVTTMTTEERRKGIASFRVNSFGDISHLYAIGEPPAFAARFCETYDNEEERHD